MPENNITYLHIPLTPEVTEKLGIAIRAGKLGDKEIVDYNFESTNTENISPIQKAIDFQKNQSQRLSQFKIQIKDFLSFDLEKALLEFKNRLLENSKTYDSIILLMAKYRRIGNVNNKGIIAFQEAELEITKIENAVMYMVNNITEEEIS